MKHWKDFQGYDPDIVDHNKRSYDNNIFTFDIETSSYLKVSGCFYPASEYKKFKEDEVEYFSSMYIWMFGINEDVYYGRTWNELKEFMMLIDSYAPDVNKIIFVHNLAFEFQFLFPHFKIKNIFARTKRKVITFDLDGMNFSFRCSLFLTNASLEFLPEIYHLPREKQVGSLDYDLIRNQYTKLTEQELKYCEYDCLVLYDVIHMFKDQYSFIYNIPKTSTGIVRKEFKERVKGNHTYYNKIKKAYNKDPEIYNMMVRCFQGGYTHANFIYAGDVIEDVDSFDEVSAYPAHMLLLQYPSTEFKKCFIKKVDDMISQFCYLLKVRFYNVKSRYYNHFISYSKCYDMYDPVCDNGRIVSATSFYTYCTCIDLKLYLDAYECEYEIEEAYYSIKKYLPIDFIKFVLEKYKVKTELKGIDPMNYALEKNKFNALYGMSVTNTIRANVEWSGGEWNEIPLSNEEIINKLNKEFNYAFLAFSWGIFITSYSRDTLCRQIMLNDEYLVYSDTDSLKLKKGYSKQPIIDYNNKVIENIKKVCELRNLDPALFAPKDSKGKSHMIGLFDYEETYEKFKTLGAKKYCTITNGELEITVSGIPKKNGKKCISDIKDFKKGTVFPCEVTGKKSAFYNDDMPEHFITDYQGNQAFISSGAGITIVGTDYTLGITHEYENLIMSSRRAIYGKEKTDSL